MMTWLQDPLNLQVFAAYFPFLLYNVGITVVILFLYFVAITQCGLYMLKICHFFMFAVDKGYFQFMLLILELHLGVVEFDHVVLF